MGDSHARQGVDMNGRDDHRTRPDQAQGAAEPHLLLLPGDATLSESPDTTQTPRLTVRCGCCTVVGRRERNEDSFYRDDARGIWAVSDGIGGAPFGDVMSRIACNYFPTVWDDVVGKGVTEEARLARCVTLIDGFVSTVSDLLGHEGSGATLLLASFDGLTLRMASVGDCHAYLARGETLSLLNANNGRKRAGSNELDMAIGYHIGPIPDVISVPTEPGDVVLLCSDGVWATQDKQSLAAAIGGLPGARTDGMSAQQLAIRSVRGSDMSDNATAVVLAFDGILVEGAPKTDSDSDRTPIIGVPAGRGNRFHNKNRGRRHKD